MAGTKPRAARVKFVGQDAAGLPVKRKQVQQACLPCRKRKKRCHHVPQSAVAGATATTAATTTQNDETHEVISVGKGADRGVPKKSNVAPDRDTSDAAAQLIRFFHHASDKPSGNGPEDDERRPSQQMSPAPPFLGDLNPEGILVEATMATASAPKSSRPDEQPDHQIIGFMPPASPRRSRTSPTREQRTVSPQLAEERPGPFFSVPREDGTRSTIQVHDTAKFTALVQTIVNRGLADKVIPSDTEWQAMRDLYLAKIHPIFPIFEKSTLTDLPDEIGLRQLIQATVCLAAATDPELCSSLTFKSHPEGSSSSRSTVPFDEYSREMANFINRRLTELQETRQIPLTHQIQVMAVTCFYWQPTSPAERFEPLSLYARLVSVVHTHGVHLELLARAQAEGSNNPNVSGSRLFKCMYALDRLMGTMYARPLMFHNVDLIRVPRPEAHDPPTFRLFLSLILLLDQVIELYRPNPKISYVELPVYERMAIEAGAQCEPESILATLEVLYHAIGVLSVRMPRYRFRTAPECDTVPGPRTQHLPPSSVNARRSHSADRILDVISDYKLSPMPFVPYALALSLSVAYRKWRFSQLPMFRTRGGADFKKVLPVLQELGKIWSSARVNGQLGQTVMLKLDRNELNRKRTKEAAEAAKAKRQQAGTLTNDKNAQLPTANPSSEKRTAPSTARTASNAPSSPRRAASTDNNGFLGPPPSLRSSLPSPGASSAAQQAQHPFPLTWTTTLTTDNNSNLTNNPSWPVRTRDDTLEQPPATSAYDLPLTDDAIPLPGDFLPTSQPTINTEWNHHNSSSGKNDDETSPLGSGLPDGNIDDFLMDDDALFKAWDPRFAQSVDFSFSSILDPGNPFAWPEYCNYGA
ncbi:hypothetical protein VTI74DRAFT_9608 [Chaetomium olivicolor]